MGVAWYRFRTTFGDRRGSVLAIVLLVGVLGGLSMGSFAAARTTESSFSNFGKATDTPDLFVLDGVYNPSIGLDSGYNPSLLKTIARLPGVKRVESDVEVNVGPVEKNGDISPVSLGSAATATVNGLDFNEDRVVVTGGRMANPRRADEIVLDSKTARVLGLHLGQTAEFGYLTNTQGNSVVIKIPRDQRFKVKVVGVGAVQVNSLFNDEDNANGDAIELTTPALTNKLLECCTSDMLSGLTLDGGSRDYTRVENEVRAVLPHGLPFVYVEVTSVEARAVRTLKPLAIALGVFGGIAALAAILIAGQVTSRRIRTASSELAVLRALGATPATIMSDGLIGTLGAIVAGSLLAFGVAVALSPLAPLGPVRQYIALGPHVDWLVLPLGTGVLVVVLAILAVAAASRAAPHRTSSRLLPARETVAGRAATASGLPPAAVAGIRFALEPGAGRDTVPVRSAILGAVMAMVVVVSTITFGASMSTLTSHPSLYGWNWTDAIDGGGGLGDIPGTAAAKLLNADPHVASWTGVYFSTLQFDGVNVPVMGTDTHAPFGPPLLSGRAVAGSDQVVLGAATMALLHKQVGDSIEVGVPHVRPARLTIVGTATLPAIGVIGSSHLEMGQGAVVPYTLIPSAARNIFDVSAPGPNYILVRLKPGTNQAAGFRSLQAIGRTLQIRDNGGSVVGVERPAEILNYRTLGTTPALLGGALGAGAVCALALTLVTSVRRRRRDLALLKTLGFTRRQLASSIAWQASIAVGIGCLIGIPVGIALGRVLWDLFAHEINAIPDPVVPASSVALLALAALVLGNLVALIPARIAARTTTARLLREE